MGFYYSLYEWFNPLYHEDVAGTWTPNDSPDEGPRDTVRAGRRVERDGEWDHPSSTWKAEEFLAWLFNESRWGGRSPSTGPVGQGDAGEARGYYTRPSTASSTTKDAAVRRDPAPLGGVPRGSTLVRIQPGGDGRRTIEPEKLVALLGTRSAAGGTCSSTSPRRRREDPRDLEGASCKLGEFLKGERRAIYRDPQLADAVEARRPLHGEGDASTRIVLGWPGGAVTLKTPRRPGTTKGEPPPGRPAPVRSSKRPGLGSRCRTGPRRRPRLRLQAHRGCSSGRPPGTGGRHGALRATFTSGDQRKPEARPPALPRVGRRDRAPPARDAAQGLSDACSSWTTCGPLACASETELSVYIFFPGGDLVLGVGPEDVPEIVREHLGQGLPSRRLASGSEGP